MRKSVLGILRGAGALAVALLMAGSLAAQEPGKYFGLDFPDRLRDSSRLQITDYENRGHPGLGYSAAYSTKSWKADIYIYDLRIQKIPDNLDSREIAQQLQQATRDVTASGAYRDVIVGDRFSINDKAGAERFVCRSFTYTHAQVGPARSALCLTAWRGKFVKIRLTSPLPGDATAFMGAFASEWIPRLWPQTGL